MKKIKKDTFINLRYFCIIFIIVFGLIAFVACGGGGGDGGSPPQPQPLVTTCEDVSGTWHTEEVNDQRSCGEGIVTKNLEYTVTQSGCNITVDAGKYGIHSGTVNGNKIKYTGSYPEDGGGTTSINDNLTISNNSLTGSTTWTWREGNESCSGTTQITGTRDPITGVDKEAPSVPEDLTATAVSSSQINLSWNASTDNVGVTGYSIYRDGSGSPLKTVTGTSTTDTGLNPSTTYCYRVLAYDAAGNKSTLCAQECATSGIGPGDDNEAPSVPEGLTVTGVSSSQINLSWNASTDNVGVTGYSIYRDGTLVKNVTGTSTTDTGLRTYSTYCYRILAYDAANNPSALCAQECGATKQGGPTTLKIVNDLYSGVEGSIDWGDLNTAITIRVGPTQNSVISGNGSYELLQSLDSVSDVSKAYEITPGNQQTFDISEYSFTSEYYVFIELGWWDYFCSPPSYTSCYWTKHYSAVYNCDGSVESGNKWSTVHIIQPFYDPEEIDMSAFFPAKHWYGTAFCQ